MSEIEKIQNSENNINAFAGGDKLDLGGGSAEEFDPFGDTTFANEPEAKPKETAQSSQKTKSKALPFLFR